MRLLALSLCVSVSANATAQTLRMEPSDAPWRLVGETARFTVGVDTSRVQIDTLGIIAWVRVEYRADQWLIDSVGPSFRRAYFRQTIDCEGQRVIDLERDVFNAQGVWLGGNPRPPEGWRPWAGHPLAEHYPVICRALGPRDAPDAGMTAVTAHSLLR